MPNRESVQKKLKASDEWVWPGQTNFVSVFWILCSLWRKLWEVPYKVSLHSQGGNQSERLQLILPCLVWGRDKCGGRHEYEKKQDFQIEETWCSKVSLQGHSQSFECISSLDPGWCQQICEVEVCSYSGKCSAIIMASDLSGVKAMFSLTYDPYRLLLLWLLWKIDLDWIIIGFSWNTKFQALFCILYIEFLLHCLYCSLLLCCLLLLLLLSLTWHCNVPYKM